MILRTKTYFPVSILCKSVLLCLALLTSTACTVTRVASRKSLAGKAPKELLDESAALNVKIAALRAQASTLETEAKDLEATSEKKLSYFWRKIGQFEGMQKLPQVYALKAQAAQKMAKASQIRTDAYTFNAQSSVLSAQFYAGVKSLAKLAQAYRLHAQADTRFAQAYTLAAKAYELQAESWLKQAEAYKDWSPSSSTKIWAQLAQVYALEAKATRQLAAARAKEAQAGIRQAKADKLHAQAAAQERGKE